MTKLKDWSTENKVFLGIFVAIVVGFIVWRIYESNKSGKNLDPSKTTPSTKPGDTSTDFKDAVNINLVLKKGSSGNSVKRLQQDINEWIKTNNKYTSLIADGFFGAGTESVLKQITGKTEISINAFENGYLF